MAGRFTSWVALGAGAISLALGWLLAGGGRTAPLAPTTTAPGAAPATGNASPTLAAALQPGIPGDLPPELRAALREAAPFRRSLRLYQAVAAVPEAELAGLLRLVWAATDTLAIAPLEAVLLDRLVATPATVGPTWRTALALPAFRRATALHAVLSRWARVAPTPALEALLALPAHELPADLNGILLAIVEAAPEEALGRIVGAQVEGGDFDALYRLQSWIERGLERWAQSDPLAALAFVRVAPNAQDGATVGDIGWEAVGRGWAQVDPWGAFQGARQLPATEAKAVLLGVMESTSLLDPGLALRFLLDAPDIFGGRPETAVKDALATIAEREPKSFFEKREQLAQHYRIEDTAELAFAARTRQDAAAAWRAALAMPEADRARALLACLRETEPTEHARLLAELPRLPAGAAKQTVAKWLVHNWPENDWQRGEEWAERNLAGADLEDARDQFFRRAIARDPGAMRQRIEAMPIDMRRLFLSRQLVDHLAEESPLDAFLWAARQPNADLVTYPALKSVVGPEAAQELLQAVQLLAPDALNLAVSGVAHHFMHLPPQERIAFFQQWPASSSRDHYLAQAYEDWIAAAPNEAAPAVDRLPPGHIRQTALAAFARTTAESNPEAAFQWAQALPEADDPHGAILGIIEVTFSRDTAKAEAMAQAFPEGEAYDQAAGIIALSHALTAPARSVEWYASIASPTTRKNLLEKMFSAIRGRSPELSAQLLSASGLTPEEKLAFLRSKGGP